MGKEVKMQTESSSTRRNDILALAGGLVFSVAFTGLIWWIGRYLAGIPHLPDEGASWYYWKLPSPAFWSRATAWGLYLAHQVTLWGLIYYAQTRVKKYTTGLHPVNVAALGINALFIFLHLLQTQVWYDGLAQDVSIFTSQGSVIVMLVWILLMENSRRGLFFGRKAPIGKSIVQAARKYHGYLFAWAAVYTFWYHPMENTWSHLIGFLYMFLLLLQGSLFFTRIHINRWWTVTQEVAVLIHGTIVALLQGNNLWPMFAFGFGGIFVITQMHGLGLSLRMRGAILAVYAALVVWVYSGRGLAKLNEIIRIPLIEYLAVFVLALLIGAALWIARRVRPAAAVTAGE
jgi:hypothetical protein